MAYISQWRRWRFQD